MKGVSRAVVPMVVAVCWTTGLPATASAGLTISGRVAAPSEIALASRITLLPESTAFERGERILAGDPEVEPIAVGVVGPDGRFELDAPKPGLWRLRLEAPGALPLERVLHPLVSDLRLPDVELVPDLGLRVFVLGPSGEPVAGARLRAAAYRVAGELNAARAGGWRVPERRAVTSNEGVAVLPAARGELLRIETIAAGFESPTVASGEREVTVRLTRGVPRTVVVRAPGGEPVAGAVVRVGESGWPVGLTDSEGAVRLTTVADRPLVLRAVTADGQRARALLQPPLTHELIVLQLVRPNVRRGRVEPLAGELPPGGAVVWNDENPAGAVRTGDDGRFDLEIPAWQRLNLWAGAEGFVTTMDPPSERAEVVLRLRPAATLTGRVLSPSGTPVSGALVVAGAPGSGQASPVSAEVREEGLFELRQLDPATPCRLVATAPGRLEAEIELAPGWDSRAKPLRLTLERATDVTGRVLDPTGQPVAGAQVVLAPEVMSGITVPPTRSPVRATTGESGRFRLGSVAGGHVRLRIEAEGYVAFERSGLEARPPEPLHLGDLYLDPGVELAVWVTEPSGKPVVGAEVAHSPASGPAASCTTGPSGACLVSGLAAEAAVSVAVRSGTVTMAVKDVVPGAEPLLVTLPSPHRLAGLVIDQDGRGLADAPVRVRVEGIARQGGRQLQAAAQTEALSDELGRFVVDSLPSGRLEVTVELDGFRPLRRIVAAVPKGEMLLQLEKGSALSGTVLGPDDRPLAGARVVVQSGTGRAVPPSTTVSDEDGQYLIAGISSGDAKVTGHHRDYLADHRDVKLEEEDNRLDLQLGAGSRVSGWVVDTNGSPVARCRVTLLPLTGSGTSQTAVTAEDGNFAIEPVAPAIYRLTAVADRLAPGELDEPLEVGPEEVAEIELVLPAGAGLTGRLLGLADEDVTAVRVSALGTGGIRRGGEVSADGGYRIDGLAPGRWLVRADHPRGSRARGQVRIAVSQGEASLDLDLGSTYRVRGQVLADGIPLPGARVELVPAEATRAQSARTDAHGRFIMDGVPAGRLQLRLIQPEAGLCYMEEISIEADRSWSVDIATAPVSGTALHSRGQVPATATVVRLVPRSRPAGGLEVRTLVGSDGGFHFSRVAAGSYTLLAMPPQGSPVEAEVSVVPGRPVSDIELLID